MTKPDNPGFSVGTVKLRKFSQKRKTKGYLTLLVSLLILALATLLTAATSAMIVVLSVLPKAFANSDFLIGGPQAYTFDLLAPNIALSDGSGHYPSGYSIKATGSGWFDLDSETISGEGNYRILDENGRIADRGIWTATRMVTFEKYGGPAAWIQGGTLIAEVQLSSSITGVTRQTVATVTCTAGDPPEDAEEGITITHFPVPASGEAVFQLDRPS